MKKQKSQKPKTNERSVNLAEIYVKLKEAYQFVQKTFPDDWQERIKPVKKVFEKKMQPQPLDKPKQVLEVLPDLLDKTKPGVNVLVMATAYEMIKEKDHGTTKPA